MSEPQATDEVAQAIWQTYAIEVGRSLPEGLADKLADAAREAMKQPCRFWRKRETRGW